MPNIMDFLSTIMGFGGGGQQPGAVPAPANIAPQSMPGAPMPRANPARELMSGAVPGAPNLDPYAEDPNGPLGRMLANAFGAGAPGGLRDALAGMGASDPSQPFLQTMGQSAAGANISRKDRLDRKRDLATAKIEEDRKVRDEGRDDRRLKLTEEAGERATERGKYANLNTASQIAEREAKSELLKLGIPTTAQSLAQIKEARLMFDSAHPDAKFNGLRNPDGSKMTVDDIREEMRGHVQNILKQSRELTTPGEPPAPGIVPPAAELTKDDLPPIEPDPLTGVYNIPPNVSEQEQMRYYDRIPEGKQYRNPSDGKTLIKSFKK